METGIAQVLKKLPVWINNDQFFCNDIPEEPKPSIWDVLSAPVEEAKPSP